MNKVNLDKNNFIKIQKIQKEHVTLRLKVKKSISSNILIDLDLDSNDLDKIISLLISARAKIN